MAELVIKLVNGELAGKTAQSIAKEIRDAGTAARKAEVGTKAWIDAHAKLDKAKALQQDLRKQVEATTSASDQLKNAWNNLPGAQFFNQVADSFGLMKSGVGGLITQFGALKTAIALTGVGLLVIAFATLYDWLKKTDEGATLLAGIFKGFENLTDKLFSALRGVGETLFQAFQNPKQAIIDLLKIIGNNLLNRVKALGVIFEGIMDLDFKKVADGTIQFASGIENATDIMIKFGEEVNASMQEGIGFEKQLDKIADRARELSIVQKESEGVVKALMLQSKNVALTYEERLEALDKASTIELRNHNLQLQNAKDLEIVWQKEIAQKRATGKAIDDVEQKLADATIARIERENESVELQQKIENRRSLLLEERQREIEKQAADELKVRQNVEKLQIEAMEEGLEKEIEQIKLETEERIEALTGSAEQILEQEKLLLEIRENEINALLDSYAAEQAEKDEKAREEAFKALMEDYDKRIEEAEQYENAKRQIEQESFDAAQDISGGFIDLLSTDEKARKKHASAIKAIQVGSVTASLASEIQAIWEHANKNPANALFPGAATIIAVVKTVAAAARAGAALGRINSAKFAMGGLLKGPKHAQGGIPGVITTTGQPIEMEGDEFIFSGKATRAIGANTLTRLNSYLTRRMATGGPVNPFPDRAPVASGAASRSTASAMLPEASELISEVRGLRADVSEWQRTLKVVNVVTETEAGIKTINSIKAEADV